MVFTNNLYNADSTSPTRGDPARRMKFRVLLITQPTVAFKNFIRTYSDLGAGIDLVGYMNY